MATVLVESIIASVEGKVLFIITQRFRSAWEKESFSVLVC